MDAVAQVDVGVSRRAEHNGVLGARSPECVASRVTVSCVGLDLHDPNGHHIVNRSNADVMLLEIGSRMPGEAADYPDIDLKAVPEDGKLVFRHKDGSAY